MTTYRLLALSTRARHNLPGRFRNLISRKHASAYQRGLFCHLHRPVYTSGGCKWDSTPMIYSEPMSRFLDLPYDVILDVIPYLSAADIVRLLSTCRLLRTLTQQESMWKHLCAQYGLHDVTYFGDRSFYTVYTGLLHTYGPVIGVWASDTPYTGTILQFHLDPGNEHRQGGIIGEVWRFRPLEPEEPDTPEVLEPPTFIRLIRIGFDVQTSTISPRVGRSPVLPNSAQIFCFRGAPGDEVEHADGGTLVVVSGMMQGVFVHTRDGQYPHPDFPGPNADVWHDAHHPFPRVQQSSYQLLDQTEDIILLPRPRVPMLYTAPVGFIKPPAIVFDCAHGCFIVNRPFLGFTDLTWSTPRFYPLRAEPRHGISPCSESWRPESLIGVWFGTYGPHGTECTYVHWDSNHRSLSAWKITGDENVPRGAVTWTFDMTSPYRVPPSQRAMCLQLFGDLEKCRLYSGTGATSARGYMPHQRIQCFLILGIVGPDELRIWWVESEDEKLSTFVRYKGRDLHVESR